MRSHSSIARDATSYVNEIVSIVFSRRGASLRLSFRAPGVNREATTSILQNSHLSNSAVHILCDSLLAKFNFTTKKFVFLYRCSIHFFFFFFVDLSSIVSNHNVRYITVGID